jgi:STE24 endopeptidase
LKHGEEIPPEFEGEIDSGLLKKTSDYTFENTRFGIFSSIFDETLLLIFIFSGLLAFYDSWIKSLDLNFILSGISFIFILTWLKTIIDSPFDIYSSFKIEKKYGFNTMTPKLWISDFIKGLAISTLLMGLLLAAALWIIQTLPNLWWLPVWAFFFIFSIFMMYISPYILEPLFNKFTPLDDEELESKIKEALGKTGIKISRVFKMDASKRTKHTNAYFTGIGKTKRIVLYDTLLEKLEKDEIVAVLAHEAGHWKKKHILKYIIFFEAFALAGAFIAFYILKSDFLGKLFFIPGASFFTKLILLSFIASIVMWPVSPLVNIVSRFFEREADDFACNLVNGGDALASALVKLSKDNLSNLHPHPLYAKFHYSHPPATERIRYLRNKK